MKHKIYITALSSESNTGRYDCFYLNFVKGMYDFPSLTRKIITCDSINLSFNKSRQPFNNLLSTKKIIREIKIKQLYYEI
jgi:hypothetical protein